MVKKKIHEQGEPEQNIKTETPDNKKNIDIRDNEEEVIKDTGETGDQVIPETSAQANESEASDKTVTSEKNSEEKLAEMQDRYLRLSAEFDNYRKRTLREKIELSKYAGEEILLKILPVLDDFERALSHMDSTTDCSAMKSGIDLIYQKFSDFLKQNDIREIETLNCTFNVDLHDAVAKVSVDDADNKGKIIDVIQKGYYLKDKVIRHSKVVVGE